MWGYRRVNGRNVRGNTKMLSPGFAARRHSWRECPHDHRVPGGHPVILRGGPETCHDSCDNPLKIDFFRYLPVRIYPIIVNSSGPFGTFRGRGSETPLVHRVRARQIFGKFPWISSKFSIFSVNFCNNPFRAAQRHLRADCVRESIHDALNACLSHI